jgi:hypothetical protein
MLEGIKALVGIPYGADTRIVNSRTDRRAIRKVPQIGNDKRRSRLLLRPPSVTDIPTNTSNDLCGELVPDLRATD